MKITFKLILATLFFCVVSKQAKANTEGIIPLYPGMVVNEVGLDNAVAFIDEPSVAGDPKNGEAGEPSSQWEPGWASYYYPATMYINLNKEYVISDIYLFDTHASGVLSIEIGEPGNWEPLFSYTTSSYKSWKGFTVDKTTQYVRIIMESRDAHASEIVLYGHENTAVIEPEPSDSIIEEPDSIPVIDPEPIDSISPTDSIPIVDPEPVDSIEAPIDTIPSIETGVPAKINITSEMLAFDSEVKGIGDPTLLFDEQELSGDPLFMEGGSPKNSWKTGWNSQTDYPVYVAVNLPSLYKITQVFIYDDSGSGDFYVYVANPEENMPLFWDDLGGYKSWNQHDLDTITNVLYFEKTGNYSVNEVVIYGYPVQELPNADDIEPEKIEDLSVSSTTANSAQLQWTAPGDDDDQGTVAAYDIRYASEPIDETNFEFATPLNFDDEIVQAGEIQQMSVAFSFGSEPIYFAMRAEDEVGNLSLVSNSVSVTFAPVSEEGIIVLDKTMLINEYCQGDASLLIDEQSTFGTDQNPQTHWFPDYNTWMFPVYALIDLKGQCTVEAIQLYDLESAEQDSTPVRIYVGEPFNWQLVITDSLKNTEVWNQHLVNTTTRFIRIEYPSNKPRLGEIVVQGSRVGDRIQEPERTVHQASIMKNILGVNSFPNDPIGRMEVAGFIREYHDWLWNDGNGQDNYEGYPNNALEFKTMGIDFDAFYNNLKKANLGVVPAIQGSVPYLVETNAALQDKPVYQNGDPLNPASYIAHADFMYQFAARYGTTPVPDSKLKIASSNISKSGLNTVQYFENWNEQDKWWNGSGAYFTPYEYMAMSSADYDGHKGTMGETVGIKNADSNAKLAMAGLAKTQIDYVKAMKLWSDYYRDGDFMFDVINLHVYCNNHHIAGAERKGMAPEVFGLKEKMEEIVDYRDRYLPGKEVWISEFGYDVNPNSPQRAYSIGNFSTDQVQGMWIVRSFLEFAAAGVDKAMQYMLRDVDENSATQYSSAGLVRSKSEGYTARPAWYYMYTLKNTLGEMAFSSELESGNSNVRLYRFANPNNGTSAYVAWCPTDNDTRVGSYNISLGSNEKHARVIALNDWKVEGTTLSDGAVSGSVQVNVSESPIIILVAESEADMPIIKTERQLTLSASNIENTSGLGNANNMVDEQHTVSNVLYGNAGNAPTTDWDLGYFGPYPGSAIIDLGKTYEVSKLVLYDSNSSGKVTLEAKINDTWELVAEDELDLYNSWKVHVVNKTTRYIRVTEHSRGALFNELGVFVKE